MAITYNHAQLNVVDGSGNLDVVYPQNYGEDVVIEKGTNTYLNNKNIDSAQELAENIGTDMLSRAADCSYSSDTHLFKLIDGSGKTIKEVEIEGGGGSTSSVLVVTTNINSFLSKTVTVKGDSETLTGTFNSAGGSSFKLKYVGTYTVTVGDVSEQATNYAFGTTISTQFIGQKLTVSTTTESFIGKTVTCVNTAGTETATGTFGDDGTCILYLATAGEFSVSCEGYTESVTATGIGGSDISVKVNEIHIYGFHISDAESRPASLVTYPSDVLNANFTPVSMNYTTGKIDYGDWQAVLDDWLMPRPCMLTYDGVVDYYLNPDDYTKKEDGTNSDIANTSYGGNAMMEWGKNGKKIWYKVVPDSDSTNETAATVYIADKQGDADYVDYAFHGRGGGQVDHFYTPIYNGSYISSKLRSLSGQTTGNSQEGTTEITYATNNGAGWYTEDWADATLINYLLLLIGKNANTQAQFGNGHYTGGSSASNLLKTGTMNTKGLFWGTNGTGSGVKVFGMENWWANIWRRTAGLILDGSTLKVKMTYGTEDGSTTTGYNTTASGYISLSYTLPSGGYVIKMKVTKYGLIPFSTGGSDSTYWCDYFWVATSQKNYLVRGGNCDDVFRCGAFYLTLGTLVSLSSWNFGASLSFKLV